VALASFAVLTLATGAAWAKVRTGTVTDPREASLPEGRDIQQVTASYDDRAGTFSVVVRFYGAIAAASGTSAAVMTVEFGPQGAAACVPARPNTVVFLADLDPNRTTATVTSPRSAQPLPGTKGVSADRREVRLSASRTSLAGMDLRCAQVTVRVVGEADFDHLERPVFFAGPFSTVVPACVVPKLVGRTLVQARAAATGASCSVGTVRRARSKRIQAGRIVSQRPAPGARLPIGSRIAVVVSRGR